MLKKLGWKEGRGLGKKGSGMAEPVSEILSQCTCTDGVFFFGDFNAEMVITCSLMVDTSSTPNNIMLVTSPPYPSPEGCKVSGR